MTLVEIRFKLNPAWILLEEFDKRRKILEILKENAIGLGIADPCSIEINIE